MANSNTLDKPIINSPFEEPRKHWDIRPHEPAELVEKRRPPTYSYVSSPSKDDEGSIQLELQLVSLIRERLKAWRPLALKGEGGVTGMTMTLLQHWQREGREQRLFFAQREAAEAIIFLTEARADFLQGVDIPLDEPADHAKKKIAIFHRRCCRMATGAGKTTVMGMLAAWSILNKVNSPQDSRFSNAILVVCPNVTIRSRLSELKPSLGDASIYRTRDLVPSELIPQLQQGKVHVINWHLLELVSTQAGSRVVKTGQSKVVREEIRIGDKTQMVRGKRHMTKEDFDQKRALGFLTVIKEEKDKIWIESERHVESDHAFVKRILDKELGSRSNILVFNDEAHHAYRLHTDEKEESGSLKDEEETNYDPKEATVWVEGLDRIHQDRKINFCADFSATPYFLGKTGEKKNRIFPWTISSFSLEDAIESGLVKIPQLAARDTTGTKIPGYFNIWEWILPRLTAAERGGKKSEAKPQAILKHAHTPIAMLAGSWEKARREMEKSDDKRPPVFIIVCKTTKLAKVVFEWLAEDKPPMLSISSANIPSLQNKDGKINTIRVDSAVQRELDSGNAKSDMVRWMRHTLDTVGKSDWLRDQQKKTIYPDGFEELAKKLGRPTHPPGRDVRCIVSVGMLTEGWDCNTVTHIIGLRPFMSQLLCEQVIGRGLRRMSYGVGDDGLMNEEVATVLGVPLRAFPVKATGKGVPAEIRIRHHIYALPERAELEIKIPRVEGYRQGGNGSIPLCNVDSIPICKVDPGDIPTETQVKATLPSEKGPPSVHGPGALKTLSIEDSARDHRLQEKIFTMTKKLMDHENENKKLLEENKIQANRLFWYLYKIVDQAVRSRVKPIPPADLHYFFQISSSYGHLMESLQKHIKFTLGEPEIELPRYESLRGKCRTGEVDFWTLREPYDVVKSHVKSVVPDTKKLEQKAAYRLDNHDFVEAFVKNEGLGFGVPYFYDGETHDYMPDFVIRLQNKEHLILETKGYDELKDVKLKAAERWVNAVNADGHHGVWHYRMVDTEDKIDKVLDEMKHS